MISKNDVNLGDMLLYVLNEKPQFLPFKKGNTWENFHVLIDRLIITMSGSMCTHSALAANENDTAVEATVPYCRYRKGMYVDGYQVLVRRVATKGKGAAVLDFLPAGINPNTNDFTCNEYLAHATESPAMQEAVKTSKDHSKVAQIILSDTFRILSLLGFDKPPAVYLKN